VKIRMEEMEKYPYCASLERYKQKITTYFGREPYVKRRSDFSTELKDLPAIEEVDFIYAESRIATGAHIIVQGKNWTV